MEEEFKDRVYHIREGRTPPVRKSYWEYEELIRRAHGDIESGNLGLRGERDEAV